MAAEHGHANIVTHLLLCGVDPATLDNEGNTALHSAAIEGQVLVVDALLQAAPWLRDVKNNAGKRPFDVASGNRDVRRALQPEHSMPALQASMSSSS